MVRRRSCAVSNHESPDAAILRDVASRLLRMRVVVHPKAVMNLPATFVIDTPGDAARAAELRRVKLLATSVLAATFAIFLGAKALLPVHPAFGFIAAFAEAATIGGIADWLRDRKRSEDLARFALRLLPEAIAATENSGLMTFVSRRITAQLMSIDLAPLAAGTLRAFVREGRHQGLLDDILRAVHQTLTQAETMAMIREKIRAELPTLLKLYRADKFLVTKIVASASAFFEEVRNDPKHPFRGEFDRMVLTFVDRLGTDPAYAERIQGLKRDLLARPELSDLARHIWANA